MKQYRQGDLLLQSITSIPKSAKKLNTLILLRGEATGHTHRIESGQVFSDSGLLYIALSNPTSLVHEEHSPIKLPKGLYAVKRQKEYASKDMVRLVVD